MICFLYLLKNNCWCSSEFSKFMFKSFGELKKWRRFKRVSKFYVKSQNKENNALTCKT